VQQRQERVLRQREDRELRRLPPAQRVQRREEINRNRAQRAQQRQQQQLQQVQPLGVSPQPGATTLRSPTQRSVTPRRGGQARVTTQAARQGRSPALRLQESKEASRLGSLRPHSEGLATSWASSLGCK
jgi:hypothetical protein